MFKKFKIDLTQIKFEVLILNLYQYSDNYDALSRSLPKKKGKKRSLPQQWDEQAHGV